MPIDFYYLPFSPPCRSILMVAEALHLKLNLKTLNTLNGEHLTPEFIKINPQHCIPTIVDNGLAVWESRAICTYLINQYGRNSGLYPEDPKTRAMVDQRLYFDMGTLFQRFHDYFYPQISSTAEPDEAKLKKVEEALGFLNIFLEDQQWVAGDHMTVADICIVATVSSFGTFDIDIFKYPNIKAWYSRVKTTAPGFKQNEEGAATFTKVIEDLKKKVRGS